MSSYVDTRVSGLNTTLCSSFDTTINILSTLVINNRAEESDDIIYIKLPDEASYLPSVFTKIKKTDTNNVSYIEWNAIKTLPNDIIKLTYYWHHLTSDKLSSQNIVTLYKNGEVLAKLNVEVATKYEQTTFLNLFEVISADGEWFTGDNTKLDNAPVFSRGTLSNVLSDLQSSAEALNTLDYSNKTNLKLSYNENYFVYTINTDGYLYLTPKIKSNIADTKNINCVVLSFNDFNGICNHYYNE
jgi:hypothetical protein